MVANVIDRQEESIINQGRAINCLKCKILMAGG
jgi:hypothetical protein